MIGLTLKQECTRLCRLNSFLQAISCGPAPYPTRAQNFANQQKKHPPFFSIPLGLCGAQTGPYKHQQDSSIGCSNTQYILTLSILAGPRNNHRKGYCHCQCGNQGYSFEGCCTIVSMGMMRAILPKRAMVSLEANWPLSSRLRRPETFNSMNPSVLYESVHISSLSSRLSTIFHTILLSSDISLFCNSKMRYNCRWRKLMTSTPNGVPKSSKP